MLREGQFLIRESYFRFHKANFRLFESCFWFHYCHFRFVLDDFRLPIDISRPVYLQTSTSAVDECCAICFGDYEEEGERRPKLLPCSHTYCLGCLRLLPKPMEKKEERPAAGRRHGRERGSGGGSGGGPGRGGHGRGGHGHPGHGWGMGGHGWDGFPWEWAGVPWGFGREWGSPGGHGGGGHHRREGGGVRREGDARSERAAGGDDKTVVQCPECRKTHEVPRGGVEKFPTNRDMCRIVRLVKRLQQLESRPKGHVTPSTAVAPPNAAKENKKPEAKQSKPQRRGSKDKKDEKGSVRSSKASGIWVTKLEVKNPKPEGQGSKPEVQGSGPEVRQVPTGSQIQLLVSRLEEAGLAVQVPPPEAEVSESVYDEISGTLRSLPPPPPPPPDYDDEGGQVVMWRTADGEWVKVPVELLGDLPDEGGVIRLGEWERGGTRGRGGQWGGAEWCRLWGQEVGEDSGEVTGESFHERGIIRFRVR